MWCVASNQSALFKRSIVVLKWTVPGLYFLQFRLFKTFNIIFAKEWIWTANLWCRKLSALPTETQPLPLICLWHWFLQGRTVLCCVYKYRLDIWWWISPLINFFILTEILNSSAKLFSPLTEHRHFQLLQHIPKVSLHTQTKPHSLFKFNTTEHYLSPSIHTPSLSLFKFNTTKHSVSLFRFHTTEHSPSPVWLVLTAVVSVHTNSIILSCLAKSNPFNL